jgi:hypothetical protein
MSVLRFIRLLLVLLVVDAHLAAPGFVIAQDATPAASPLAGLGYPELLIRVTDQAIEAPARAAAGITLLTIDNVSRGNASIFLMVPPPGVQTAQLRSIAPTGGFPSYLYDAVLTGGPQVAPGERGQVLIVLVPGTWLATGFTVAGSLATTAVRVEGEATPSAEVQEPPAAMTVQMRDDGFGGLDRPIAPGSQVWKLTNTGTQPHALFLSKAPRPVTREEITRLLPLVGNPEEAIRQGLPDPRAFPPAGTFTAISAGRTAWFTVDLAPGTYVALDFLPDKQTGTNRALLGSVAVFTVSGSATPAT